MRRFFSLVALLCSLVVIGLSLALWNATGRAGFTRYFDAARAASDAQAARGSMADLFEGTGVTQGSKPMESAPNGFALGLAPGGMPTDKRFVSVLTLAGPALLAGLISLCSLLFGRIHSPQRHRGTEKSLGGGASPGAN